MSGRDDRFREEVRRRDGRCVVSHIQNVNAESHCWAGFDVAHIVPLAFETLFVTEGFSQLITNRADGETGINSCQNGMMLLSSIHQLFDVYMITVDPDVCARRVHTTAVCMEGYSDFVGSRSTMIWSLPS